MALNYIWVGFFLVAFVVALIKLIFFGDTEIFTTLVQSTFSSAKVGFEISLFLTAVISLWLGLMRIGEKGGMVQLIYAAVAPLFGKLFPSLPKNHPAFAPIVMNISANMLGLDNAATPLGLKAMESMQEANPNKDTASDAQIMFLVLNTSGLTLLPTTIMAYRFQYQAADPSDIFIPILIATFCSTLAGLIVVSLYQKINLLNKTILLYLGSLTALVGGIIWYFQGLDQETVKVYSSVASNLILFSIIISFILLALKNKVNVYEAFIEGAKEGFGMAVKIIPFLIGMLVAIGVFRACGALDLLVGGLAAFFGWFGLDTAFVDALPVAFMKPLSGSGARAMMIDVYETEGLGVDSFAGKLASVMQGSTETTLYVLAVYFGAVNIKKTRYAVPCGLIADLAGMIAAIFIAYIFFSGTAAVK